MKNDKNKLPYADVLTRQFPNAIQKLVELSAMAHTRLGDRDNDFRNFTRLYNAENRMANALMRHAVQGNKASDDFKGVNHITQVAFNALALIEILIEKNELK